PVDRGRLAEPQRVDTRVLRTASDVPEVLVDRVERGPPCPLHADEIVAPSVLEQRDDLAEDPIVIALRRVLVDGRGREHEVDVLPEIERVDLAGSEKAVLLGCRLELRVGEVHDLPDRFEVLDDVAAVTKADQLAASV